jgi:hypothetical protein
MAFPFMTTRQRTPQFAETLILRGETDAGVASREIPRDRQTSLAFSPLLEIVVTSRDGDHASRLFITIEIVITNEARDLFSVVMA